jgi:hypothetical protein
LSGLHVASTYVLDESVAWDRQDSTSFVRLSQTWTTVKAAALAVRDDERPRYLYC